MGSALGQRVKIRLATLGIVNLLNIRIDSKAPDPELLHQVIMLARQIAALNETDAVGKHRQPALRG